MPARVAVWSEKGRSGEDAGRSPAASARARGENRVAPRPPAPPQTSARRPPVVRREEPTCRGGGLPVRGKRGSPTPQAPFLGWAVALQRADRPLGCPSVSSKLLRAARRRGGASRRSGAGRA